MKKKQKTTTEQRLEQIRYEDHLGVGQLLNLVYHLSIPAIMSQITTIIMEYVDASMVGSLGATESASIGLVSSSTWLFGGLCLAVSTGFSVQVAQMIGAGKEIKARHILKQGLVVAVMFSLCLTSIGMMISNVLPKWLGGEEVLWPDAVHYFQIFVLSLLFLQLRGLAGSMLQCSGNMKTPSILNVMACGLNVIFNGLLIFPSRMINLGGVSIWMPGMGLGVVGAALGTALSELITALLMCGYMCLKSPSLKFRKGEPWKLEKQCVMKAARIGIPLGFEHGLMCLALVVATRIVAPLGTISIAANSFAVTAEGLCYMPGFGIAQAATTLIGQSIGAKKIKLVRRFARITVWFGMSVMAVTGAIMFLAAPFMMALLTPNIEIQQLGVEILRIEAFAEPLYAASIVVSGALRGAGDTIIPSIMNFLSIWCVRLTLSVLLVGSLGLVGVWIAMATELCFRGLIFLVRLYREKWIKFS